MLLYSLRINETQFVTQEIAYSSIRLPVVAHYRPTTSPAQFDPRARPFLYFDKLLRDDNEPMSSTFALTKV